MLIQSFPDESLTTPDGPKESAAPSATKSRALHVSEALWRTVRASRKISDGLVLF